MTSQINESASPLTTELERKFASDIEDAKTTGEPAIAKLHTDDRVLARITDGIYRQPSSALRELISNAYDADATEVYIDTDAPRFSQIRIRDNGLGMDVNLLTRLIHHIGGSSKRTLAGMSLGTTDSTDSSLSPGGRRLIGKIGIGLFSVSQLTSHFQVITKIKGDRFRLMADVILRTYREDDSEPSDGTFETGSVQVLPIEADDIDSHGTEIILLNIRQRVRDILQSKDRWDAIISPEDPSSSAVQESQPVWHSGYLQREGAYSEELLFTIPPKLPWNVEDSPLLRFSKLFDAIADQVGTTNQRPDLNKTLDTYLGTLWALSLSAPVPYLDKHPFDVSSEDNILVFRLINGKRGQAEPVHLEEGQTVREVLNLKAGGTDPLGGFNVYMDKIELRRPISLRYWPTQRQSIGKPMLFVGSYNPDLSSVPADVRGGSLEFESYLFWNSMIVPKENVGVLVRINGASGALFDDTFMKYQVSEQNRLRQITSEIFVRRGLDAALNIDRESFNFAHPHYQILSNWVHRSLRQLTNTHKALGDEARQIQRNAQRDAAVSKLDDFASKKWADTRREESITPPEVEILDSSEDVRKRRKEGNLAFERTQLPAATIKPVQTTKHRPPDREHVLRAIATILDGFGLLENMSYERQHDLLNSLLAVYFEDAQG